ncbi:hypothetical protein LINPERHAP1_LOCUS6266 [Linum perenne]
MALCMEGISIEIVGKSRGEEEEEGISCRLEEEEEESPKSLLVFSFFPPFYSPKTLDQPHKHDVK